MNNKCAIVLIVVFAFAHAHTHIHFHVPINYMGQYIQVALAILSCPTVSPASMQFQHTFPRKAQTACTIN